MDWKPLSIIVLLVTLAVGWITYGVTYTEAYDQGVADAQRASKNFEQWAYQQGFDEGRKYPLPLSYNGTTWGGKATIIDGYIIIKSSP